MNFTVFSILLWHEGAVQMFDWFCTLSLFILASKSDKPGWQKQPKTQHNIKTNSFSKSREREACSSFNIITITKCTFDPFLVRFNIVESPWKKLFPIITYIITTGNRFFSLSWFNKTQKCSFTKHWLPSKNVKGSFTTSTITITHI